MNPFEVISAEDAASEIGGGKEDQHQRRLRRAGLTGTASGGDAECPGAHATSAETAMSRVIVDHLLTAGRAVAARQCPASSLPPSQFRPS